MYYISLWPYHSFPTSEVAKHKSPQCFSRTNGEYPNGTLIGIFLFYRYCQYLVKYSLISKYFLKLILI